MFFRIPYLTMASHSLGWREQLLCGFFQLLDLVSFKLAGFFPCKNQVLALTCIISAP